MLFILQTSSLDHLAEKPAIIISMYCASESHLQISDHLKLEKSSLTSIIDRNNRETQHPHKVTVNATGPLMLDDQDTKLMIRNMIRYNEQNPCNNFKALGTH